MPNIMTITDNKRVLSKVNHVTSGVTAVCMKDVQEEENSVP